MNQQQTRGRLRLTINGKAETVAGPLTLAELLDRLGLDPQRVAVERNEKLIRRQEHASTVLQDGDRLEVVTFFGGG